MPVLPVLFVAFPFVARIVFMQGDNPFALSQSAIAFAMILGAILASKKPLDKFVHMKYINKWVFALGFASITIGLIVLPNIDLPINANFWLFTATVALVMIIFTVIRMIIMSTIQGTVPANMIAKVTALLLAIMAVGMPFGNHFAGTLIENFQLHEMFFGVSTTILISVLINSLLSIKNSDVKEHGK